MSAAENVRSITANWLSYEFDSDLVFDAAGHIHVSEEWVATADQLTTSTANVWRLALVKAIESEWNEQCAGNRNPEACDSCHAYASAIDTVKEVIQ